MTRIDDVTQQVVLPDVSCPNCAATRRAITFDKSQPPFCGADTLVVIPLYCRRCDWFFSVHAILKLEA